MNPMHALIIDDERLAREELRALLRSHPRISLVGEAEDAHEARRKIQELQPDLLFLDVQMPEEDGFALLESLAPPVPRVVFVSAYDRFALRAFEVNALDYLLKPVDPQRLAVTLGRLDESAVAGAGSAPPVRTADILLPDSRVFLRDGDRCWFVTVRDLKLLEAAGNFTRVHFGTDKPLLPRSLASLAPRLPANLFFRANRSQIINLSFIESVEPWFANTIRVRLQSVGDVELSRRQSLAFRESRGL